ncbi:hypothetical protein CASFOL_021670 [Castilleja foliolosa]|uniref:J domain-containing protein n=1 Tax=Castilleja foliolosa TaxID=1961234 RepID=A0ABD3D0P2_9LAMI
MALCRIKRARRAKDLAVEKMERKDFSTAKQLAMIAKKLNPDLEDIAQIILICDVHCSCSDKKEADEDWYKILGLDPMADEASVKRHYNKMALSLHPDKNQFPGSVDAFGLICRAKAVLVDNEERRLYDSRRRAKVLEKTRNCFGGFSGFVNDDKPGFSKFQNSGFEGFGNGPGPVDRGSSSAVKPGKHKLLGHERNKKAFLRFSDMKNLEYSDSELNDFEEGRAKMGFGPGQIWAVYDTLDAMPRFYALINNVTFSDEFKVNITWLEPCPENAKEKKWLCNGFPASCGKFRLGESENINDHAIFSHLVNSKKGISLYEVYPRKGETWAIFKNWKMNWCLDSDRCSNMREFEFEFVEILSDYSCDCGVSVAFLGKIKGFSTLFGLINGGEEIVIPVKGKFRFSHRVLSFQMTSPNGNSRFFELDPASLPANLNTFSEISTISGIFN